MAHNTTTKNWDTLKQNLLLISEEGVTKIFSVLCLWQNISVATLIQRI